jgi:hypothetical protein
MTYLQFPACPKRNLRIAVFFVSVCLSIAASSYCLRLVHAQETLKIEPVTLIDEGTAPLTVSPPEGSGLTIDPKKLKATPNEYVTFNPNATPVTVTAKKSGTTTLELKYEDNGKTYYSVI